MRAALPQRSRRGLPLSRSGPAAGGCVSTLAGTHLYPGRRVIARSFPSPYIAVDPGLLQPRGECRVQQQVVDPQSGVPLIGVTEIVPERVDLLLGVQCPN